MALVVVITDSALNSSKPASFIGSDNRRAGVLGGRVLAQQLDPEAKGTVLNIRY